VKNTRSVSTLAAVTSVELVATRSCVTAMVHSEVGYCVLPDCHNDNSNVTSVTVGFH